MTDDGVGGGAGVVGWQARAIEIWPGQKTEPRIRHPFHHITKSGHRDPSVDWPGTQELLNMTDITKATARPWRWYWTSSNEITIYHNDGHSYEAQEVATIVCDDKDYREQSEADAELICRLANTNEEATNATD